MRPGIILTSKFVLPQAKDFQKYIDYLTRQQALLKNESHSINDQIELKRIEVGLGSLFNEPGEIELSSNSKDPRALEAEKILSGQYDFDRYDVLDFSKMVGYMSRQQALENKATLSPLEQSELIRIKFARDKISHKTVKPDRPLNGVFSLESDRVKPSDLEAIKDKFITGQKNGSVLYQDVVSFDNQFLKRNGILKGKQDLDEDKLKSVARDMMTNFFENEQLQDSGFWFASIHRNTKHVHIHFATIELHNTRELMDTKIGDHTFKQPKGKRRLKTIDQMKQTFVSHLLNRDEELKRISELRNQTTLEAKKKMAQVADPKTIRLLNELYRSLPKDRNKWHYGDPNKSSNRNQVDNQTRTRLDQLTKRLMKDNPTYKEYVRLVKKEYVVSQSIYGESTRDSKNYEKNKLADINKRMGNAILNDLKDYNNTARKKIRCLSKTEFDKQRFFNAKKQATPKLSNQILRQLKRSMNEDLEHYRARHAYEKTQREIDYSNGY
ncbi:MobP2 family relaxase [Latilactobacillus fragifolii]|uniref:MobP2 family relaxase n=1 Tax=Latilactobacillus fragifolii TaxID=2814244 RepID=UPI001ABB7A0D|nr:MobP2 family relaxase [Latilactobacillus fragifolii]